MKLLLDTHTLLWTMNNHPRLSLNARNAIKNQSNEVFISVVNVWEAATKFRQGRLPEAAPLVNDPQRVISLLNFSGLPINIEHARLSGSMPHSHKDPFDRMLAAQALLGGLTLVSADAIFDSMMVTRLW